MSYNIFILWCVDWLRTEEDHEAWDAALMVEQSSSFKLVENIDFITDEQFVLLVRKFKFMRRNNFKNTSQRNKKLPLRKTCEEKVKEIGGQCYNCRRRGGYFKPECPYIYIYPIVSKTQGKKIFESSALRIIKRKAKKTQEW